MRRVSQLTQQENQALKQQLKFRQHKEYKIEKKELIQGGSHCRHINRSRSRSKSPIRIKEKTGPSSQITYSPFEVRDLYSLGDLERKIDILQR